MRRVPLLVALLMLLHVALALSFAWIAPWRTPGVSNGVRLADIGAPDEIAHANYVRSLIRGDGIPVLQPSRAAREFTYEGYQPPVYYLLDAGFGWVLGSRDVEKSTARFPLRGLNALVGAATVAGTFLLAFLATERSRLSLCAAAIVAFLPMNAALDGAVSNDPLLIALSTFVLALGARHLRIPSPSSAIAIGVLVGLAILTKSTGLILLTILPFFLAERRHLALAWASAAVVAVPWLARNQVVYGHPLAMNVFNATFGRQVDLAALRTPYGLLHWLYVLIAGTIQSTIGEFGYMDINLPKALVFPLFGLLAVGAILGRRLPSPWRFRLGAGVYLALLLLGYVLFNLSYVQPQARYLFPGLGLVALACAAGLDRQRISFAAPLLIAGLLATDVYALATLPAAFAMRAKAAESTSVAASRGD